MESGVWILLLEKVLQQEQSTWLSPFTLIAATTRVALISAPLRSRFSGGVFRLEFYSDMEIAEIVRRSSKLLETELEEEALKKCSKKRFTPRTAIIFWNVVVIMHKLAPKKTSFLTGR